MELTLLQVDEPTCGIVSVPMIYTQESRTHWQSAFIDAQHVSDRFQTIETPLTFGVRDDVGSVLKEQAYSGHANFVQTVLLTIFPAFHVDLAKCKRFIREHAAIDSDGPSCGVRLQYTGLGSRPIRRSLRYRCAYTDTHPVLQFHRKLRQQGFFCKSPLQGRPGATLRIGHPVSVQSRTSSDKSKARR